MDHLLDKKLLKDFLEEKYKLYASPKFIEDDPIQIPHRFSRKEDIEISGLLTATLAWGTRKMIIFNIDRLLQKLGDSPFEFIVNYSEKDDYRFKNFVHRTFNENDCIQYIKVLNRIYLKEGGLEKIYSDGFQKDSTIRSAINEFRLRFVESDKLTHTLKHIPNVLEGSAAKRINMFLRWMIRPSKEGVDFGIWKSIPTTALMMPLDTHSGRVGRALGLLKRNQNDWIAVTELTDNLREFDGNDPVKYDFALFGLGVYEKFGL
jgi:uncharacterized protein (TIGR02757 family)